MPRVFVVQQQLHKDEYGVLVPKFDISAASRYGELVFVLQTGETPNLGTLDKIRQRMHGINEDDYLLLMGSPVAMGLVAIVASEYCAKINILYWNGKAREYRVTSLDLEEGQ